MRVEHDAWMNRFACLTASATFFLLIAGGLVTSTGSGLAVPDWPLSYGQLFPPMVGGIFYEHGHRMVAGTVGILMLVLAVWLQFRERRAWVRRLGLVALAAVVAQAVLGGMTVLFLLPTPVSVAHACLAQTFFCLTVTLALVTSRGWKTAATTPVAGFSVAEGGIGRGLDGRGEVSAPAAGETARGAAGIGGVPLRTAGALMTAVVFCQLAVGALMRHTGAGLAIPDFPLSFGRLVPPMLSQAVAVNFTHRVGALLVTVCAAWLVTRTLRHHRALRAVSVPAGVIALLVPLQIALGAATVWTGKAVFPATAHLATGALILAMSLLLTLNAARRLVPARMMASRDAAGPDGRIPMTAAAAGRVGALGAGGVR